MPVPPAGLADHLARRHVHRGKERRGPVALVVVGHRPAAARLQRQSRLRPVERLDRALLVKAEHDRVVRRVKVQHHNVLQLLLEARIRAHLEGTPQMGLQPCRPPHRVHEAVRRAHRPRHRPARPVRRVRGPLLRRPADDLRPQRRLRLRAPAPVVATPGTLLLDPLDPLVRVAPPPAAHLVGMRPQLPADGRVRHPPGRHQHDPRPLPQPHRRAPRPRPALQNLPVPLRNLDPDRLPHLAPPRLLKGLPIPHEDGP